MTNNTPVDHVRIGAISAAIWANETERGVRYGVTIERVYRDPESGDWRSSSSFNRDDLLPAAKVLDLAHTRIVELQTLARAKNRDDGRDDDGAAESADSEPQPPAPRAGGASATDESQSVKQKATRAKARAASR